MHGALVAGRARSNSQRRGRWGARAAGWDWSAVGRNRRLPSVHQELASVETWRRAARRRFSTPRRGRKHVPSHLRTARTSERPDPVGCAAEFGSAGVSPEAIVGPRAVGRGRAGRAANPSRSQPPQDPVSYQQIQFPTSNPPQRRPRTVCALPLPRGQIRFRAHDSGAGRPTQWQHRGHRGRRRSGRRK